MSEINVEGEKEKAIESARVARVVVNIAAGIVAMSVWYIKSRSDIITSLIKSFPADLILQLAMIIYYLSWVLGVSNDLGEQEKVLISETRQSPNAQILGLIAVLIVTFGALCLSTTYVQKFIMLLSFIGINTALHFYYKDKIINPIINYSIGIYKKENNVVNVLKAEKVKSYINGNFQIVRFIIAGVFLIIITLSLFIPINSFITTLFPNYGIEFIYSISIFVFVLGLEISVWIQRLDVKYSIKAYDTLGNNIKN